ncbi:hypothetical protein QLQ12_19040 [Actinoplanes sp. NEAU-A12]|uniref:Uncharacterized protein n=1 Tax=Actinoplanes sandaracinus TaxID=3045177 RepID=A0ABT6WLV2_9ACTN|nr:hypothetical protein [Actinoplanes sandaracinus]MDI6100709.1 hypothetical protein [Actinoplanes sandaracinus]
MTDLRALVAAGDPVSRHDALALAAGMSVKAVHEQLDETFLDNHAESASAFFQAWLPRLEPFERMQATDWVTTEYLLSMVHVEHSYGIAARLQLEAVTAAAGALAETLDDFGAFADGPDAEISKSVPDRLEQLAQTVRGVAAKLATEVDALPPRSEARAGRRSPRCPAGPPSSRPRPQR